MNDIELVLEALVAGCNTQLLVIEKTNLDPETVNSILHSLKKDRKVMRCTRRGWFKFKTTQ